MAAQHCFYVLFLLLQIQIFKKQLGFFEIAKSESVVSDSPWSSVESQKVKQVNENFLFILITSHAVPFLLLWLPSFLLSPTVNLFVWKKEKKKPPLSCERGPSWQVSCVFCFATVWLWWIFCWTLQTECSGEILAGWSPASLKLFVTWKVEERGRRWWPWGGGYVQSVFTSSCIVDAMGRDDNLNSTVDGWIGSQLVSLCVSVWRLKREMVTCHLVQL